MAAEVFIAFLAIIAVVVVVRSNWVVEKRMGLNRFVGGVHLIKGYEGYGTMMRRLWIWDIEKFRKK